jgi:tellurite resistance protein TerC
MTSVPAVMWISFGVIVAVSLVFDLVAHRGEHGASRRSAIVWSVLWIAAALAFAVWIGVRLGRGQAEDFLTAYLLEKSLSIDNLFVFLLVFSRLKMKPSEQHHVLTWGILGALVFRGIFIAAGSAALMRWHELVYALGALLVLMGIKTAVSHDGKADEDSGIMTFVRDRLRLRSTFMIAVITIEITDILFAVDSVPAVFAISSDPFIVYTSNVFAILGLRALYLVLADLLRKLRYMHIGLSAILVFAGAKMLLSSVVHIPHVVSLGAIAAIMTITIVASAVRSRR